MRPVYLAITGYLVGYLGQQRLDLQEEMRQFEIVEQRHRIARDLHDNFAQALAGINLRLEKLPARNWSRPAENVLSDARRAARRRQARVRRVARATPDRWLDWR